MIDSFQLFLIWLAFLVLVILATVPFVIWAVKSGQFSRFDYAARLPLKSKIVEEPEKPDTGSSKNVSA
jgi:nitrogen fixation-related uncharacterized protein